MSKGWEAKQDHKYILDTFIYNKNDTIVNPLAHPTPYILLLMSNPSRQYSNVQYRWGLRRRGKTGKHGKVEVKRKWWVLAEPPYSTQGNGRQAVTQGGTKEPWG